VLVAAVEDGDAHSGRGVEVSGVAVAGERFGFDDHFAAFRRLEPVTEGEADLQRRGGLDFTGQQLAPDQPAGLGKLRIAVADAGGSERAPAGQQQPYPTEQRLGVTPAVVSLTVF